jgi:hypothetical protein
MRKSCRHHAPSFKAKVALAAAREESTVTELSRKCEMHVNRLPHSRALDHMWAHAHVQDNTGSSTFVNMGQGPRPTS